MFNKVLFISNIIHYQNCPILLIVEFEVSIRMAICAVRCCESESTASEQKITLFRSPPDLPTRQHWIRFVQLSDKHFYPSQEFWLCSEHFTDNDILNKLRCRYGLAQKMVLKPNAVPSILAGLPADPEFLLTVHQKCPTSDEIEDDSQNPAECSSAFDYTETDLSDSNDTSSLSSNDQIPCLKDDSLYVDDRTTKQSRSSMSSANYQAIQNDKGDLETDYSTTDSQAMTNVHCETTTSFGRVHRLSKPRHVSCQTTTSYGGIHGLSMPQDVICQTAVSYDNQSHLPTFSSTGTDVIFPSSVNITKQTG